MNKSDKVTLVENLTSQLKQVKSLVVVNYSGLTVKSQQELIKRLNDVGAQMIVVKNTLLKRAAEAAKIDKEITSDEILSGQTALIVTDKDPVSLIQVLGKYAKEFDVPKMKIGVVDGAVETQETLMKISTLPSKEALLGQVLGSLVSSQYGLVATLQGNLQKLVYVLKAKAG